MRTIVALSISLSSSQIWAGMPVTVLKAGCKPRSAFADIIEKVKSQQGENVSLLPEQIALFQLAADRGWSPARLKKALKNNGRILCPWIMDTSRRESGTGSVTNVSLNNDNKESSRGLPAFIAGSDVTLFTATHVFRGVSPERISECRFQNFDIPSKQAKLVLQKGTYALEQGSGNDLAIIRLSKPIAGADGFKVDREGKKKLLKSEKPLVNMSQAPDGSKVPAAIPVGQVCNRTADSYWESPFGNTAGVLTVGGCLLLPGNSGSVLAQEDEESDDFYAVAIVSNIPKSEDFNAANNTGSAMPISPNIIEKMDRISGRRPGQLSSAVSH